MFARKFLQYEGTGLHFEFVANARTVLYSLPFNEMKIATVLHD